MPDPRTSSLLAPLVLVLLWTAHAGASDAATDPRRVADTDGAWEQFAMQIGPRFGHTATFDPVRRRLIVFGGAVHTAGAGLRGLNDCWVLSLSGTPKWTSLVPTGAPPTLRYGHTAIYDPDGDRIIIFGGLSPPGTYLGDCWALNLDPPSWTLLTLAGTPPPPRANHVAVYDPSRQRMWLGGGFQQDFGQPGIAYQDWWSLELVGYPEWIPHALSPGPPPLSIDATAVYDPQGDRVVLFGNAGLWTIDLSATPSPAWAAPAASGGPPAARSRHAAVLDPGGRRMLVFGGALSGSEIAGDAWALSLDGTPAWTAMPDSPGARAGAAAAYDSAGSRMVVVGGQPQLSSESNDTWALHPSAPSWSALSSADDFPDGDPASPPVLDALRDAIVDVIGGETWRLSLASRTWTRLPVATIARKDMALVLDPVRDRLLAFGGLDGVTARNDVLALDLSAPVAWTTLATTGTPPSPRSGATAVLDAARDRLIVYGGSDLGTFDDRTYALTLTGTPAWSTIGTGPRPPARQWHVAVADPPRDRMVIFGGSASDGATLTDTWGLALGGPVHWTAFGATPPPADLYGGVRDANDDRFVLVRGNGTTWAAPLASLDAWTPLDPIGAPARLNDVGAAWDPLRDLVVVPAGEYVSVSGGLSQQSLTWGLFLSPALGVPARPGLPRFSLGAPRPVPAAATLRLAVGAPPDDPVSISVFDVSGRRVRTLWRRATATSATRDVSWDLRDEEGRRVPPGLYLVRAWTDREVRARRIVVTR